jgi:hypothetical protein
MKTFLGLLCVLVVAQGCTTAGPAGTPATAPVTGCTEVTDPNGPVLCVDDSVHPPKLSSYGKTLHVHSQLTNGDQVYVTWKTVSGADLSIVVDPDSTSGKKCYKVWLFHKTCKDGACEIKVNPDAAKKQCQYDLSVNGEKVDPVIIVDEWPFVPMPAK